MLHLDKISYHVAGRTILDNAQMQLADGQKGGLVGRNGCGKSTLFKIILNEHGADSGEINISKGYRVVTVAQEVPGGEQTPLEYLLNADIERKNLMQELDICEDNNRLGDIYDRLYAIDAYSAEARGAVILKGLGFSDEQQTQPLSNFSGGFRMRVALAAALFVTPDLLLLDEPTNHLDFESIMWLENFLQTYAGSLLVISHDREFLNNVTNYIFHLQKGKITSYKGNYDAYETKYKLQLASDAKYNEKILAQKQHMQKFVDRFKAKASKAKQAQSRIKAIEKLDPITLIIDDPSIKLEFPEPEILASPIISFEKIFLGYDDNRPLAEPTSGREFEGELERNIRAYPNFVEGMSTDSTYKLPAEVELCKRSNVVLRNLSGSIFADDRIALLGANGNGKSTFAKFLAKQLPKISGSNSFSDKLKIGYFNQHQFEILDLNLSPIEHIKNTFPQFSETQVRTHLGCFGFGRDKASVKIAQISGGEKARLVFATITAAKPNILILDEPTNHLDMDMRTSLIFAINQFAGAVILIAHDMHLIANTIDKLWVVDKQTITTFNGNIDEYKKSIIG